MSSGKGEVAAGAGGLAALFSRPKTEYEDKENEQITVTPRLSDLIYIRNCKGCKFGIHGKAAKCIIESSTDVRVEFEEPLMAGTLELINNKDITISVNPQDILPTVSADGCENVHLYFYEPRALKSIYTVKCTNVVVCLQPPHVEKMVLDIPAPEASNDQYVSEYKRGKMVTEKVFREGAGYATTAEKSRQADARQAELLRRLGQQLESMITITKPGARPPPTAAGKTQQAAPKKGEECAKPEAKDEPKKEEEQTKPEAKDEQPNQDTADNSSSGVSLSAALQAKRRELKPTETVERTIPVVGVSGRGTGGRGLTNITDDDEKREYFDSPEELSKKVDRVVEWMKESKHVIMFTGAGISTSCGIPDFRSGMNTVLQTGPGVWELLAHETSRPKGSVVTPILQAIPSPSHMAIVKLHKDGHVKFTVSQNVDGIHRRSGLKPSQLAELHGNTNLETCQKCNRQYLRDFQTREAAHVFDHATSRQCDNPKCKGILEDSIINFGENLPQNELTSAFQHASKADMCIVLGSSLRVRPACQVPAVVSENGGKVVVCNLQKIPQFPRTSKTLPVFAKCDDFMTELAKRLNIEIPNFVLKRRAKVSTEKQEDGQLKVTITGLDVDEDVAYSFIKSVSAHHNNQIYEATKEPLVLNLPGYSETELNMAIHFHGHYGEPALVLKHDISDGDTSYLMDYNVSDGSWDIRKE